MTGDELKKLRQNLGWTQAKLAGALGLTVTFVGMMERGTKAVERRTELAARYLVSEAESAALYELDKPITELMNLGDALQSALEAVHLFRRSRERITRLADSSIRMTILLLAEQLTELLVEEEGAIALEKAHAR